MVWLAPVPVGSWDNGVLSGRPRASVRLLCSVYVSTRVQQHTDAGGSLADSQRGSEGAADRSCRQDVLRTPLSEYPSIVKHQDMLEVESREAQIVDDGQYSHPPLTPKRGQRLHQAPLLSDVEVHRGLVEKEVGCFLRNCHRQNRSLLLSSAEGRKGAMYQMLNLRFFHRTKDGRSIGVSQASEEAHVRRPSQSNHLSRRKTEAYLQALRHYSDQTAQLATR